VNGVKGWAYRTTLCLFLVKILFQEWVRFALDEEATAALIAQKT
jgi:hypothetical protein